MARIPLNLKEWNLKTRKDALRASVLAGVLCFLSAAVCFAFYFQAGDAFVYFRYVSNALKGFGYVWNPPPFAPVDGYTGFLWTVLLHGFAKTGITPPVAADILTFLFSTGSLGLCFAILRRTGFSEHIRNKSFILFLIVCFILLTNTTFAAFMSSGTEAALFNFLVLWWCYEASENDVNPLRLTFCGLLLALTRTEGVVFLAACLPFLGANLYDVRTKKQMLMTAAALLLFAVYGVYLYVRKSFYGSIIPNSFLALYTTPFPPDAPDYLWSFALEYGLYFWVPVTVIWAACIIFMRDFKSFIRPLMLALPFIAALAWILVLTGADNLEYRLLGYFIPVCLLAGIRMITFNVNKSFRFVCTCLALYWLCAVPLPWMHYFKTKDLNTRAKTAFLYVPVSEATDIGGFPAGLWNRMQKGLISRGFALRRQEHKVLSDELLKSFPDRKEGERIKWAHSRFFAWNFAGVPAWVLPEAYILDLSGQNDAVVSHIPVRTPSKRRLGYDRSVPSGYPVCFNGGTNIKITPFDGTGDITYMPAAPLNAPTVRGCESFWKARNRGLSKTTSNTNVKK